MGNFRRKHGEINRPALEISHEGVAFSVGRYTYCHKEIKSFHDALSNYLITMMGREWSLRERDKPFEEQHQLHQWYSLMRKEIERSTPDERGLYRVRLGAEACWARMAYDLYIVDENGNLFPNRMARVLRELRDPVRFQSTRFEVNATAVMLVAGYDLTFSPEKGPGSHPEFIAVDRRDRTFNLAVEVKSRRRSGILGHELVKQSPESMRFDIYKLLRAAISKDIEQPFVILIEVNSLHYLPSDRTLDFSELYTSWKKAQEECPNGSSCVGVVFYNDVMPWRLDKEFSEDGNPFWVYPLPAQKNKQSIDPQPVLERIVRGFRQKANIPHNDAWPPVSYRISISGAE